jgi:cyanate permease
MAGFYGGSAVASLIVGAIVDATGSFPRAFATLIGFAITACVLLVAAIKSSPFRKLAKQSK